MPQTTTALTACDVDVELDDDAGAVKNVSGSSNQVAMNFTKQVGMKRTFQTDWPIRQECGRDAAYTLTATYTSAADEAFDILKDWYFDTTTLRKRTLSVYMPKKNVGADVYRGEFRLASLNFTLSGGSADPVDVVAELVSDGAVTLTTNAT